MRTSLRLVTLAACLILPAALTTADENAVNPKIAKIVDEVSEARIKATIEKLVSFGTRNTMSTQDDPNRGVGAARQWIFNEFKSYSPRLQVSFDKYRVKKQGQRIFKDVDLWNVVAVLPGTKYPDTQVLVTGHYDSLNLGARRPPAEPGAPPVQLTPADYEKNAELPAPGACDDGSGTAAVMELARIMSQYEFDKTLVFVTFAGEEQGLVGSTLMAAKAKKEKRVIEAVLNNDIIGTDTAGNGRTGNSSVEVYSDESMDSPSQQLSRYMRKVAERYIPSMRVDTVFMQDRLGRGGDHTPFQLEGFAAVRISTPNEIYANQHHDTDLLENMSVPYTAKVARVNAAVAASLALAPKPPDVMRMPGAGRGRPGAASEGAPAAGGRGAATRRPTPMIARGSGYDAVLSWKAAGPDDNIKGYAIVIRPTTSPYWQQEIYVGKVDRYTLKDVSIDDAKFGVKAIGLDGSESLVTVYAYPPRAKAEIQTIDQ
jgi:Peptidase family M28